LTVQDAHIQALRNLLDDLHGIEDTGTEPPCTSASYLRDFIGRAIEAAPTMAADKIGRWTGFVQGVMASRGWLSVEAERNRTRGLFAPTR
jgi:hypothetical protein